MKILHLTLKKRWFDMIASGIKKEEYREIKEYWNTRLLDRDYDAVCCRNGYGKKVPEVLVELNGDIQCSKGNPEWGAPDNAVWIIPLGDIIRAKNISTEF